MTTLQIDRLDGLASSTAIKGPARCATTTNITLSDLQTIDGVALAEDDRVLVRAQTDAKDNGIYRASTGLWQRVKDFSGNRDVRKGTRVTVTDGSTHANSDWIVTTENPVVIGTSNITLIETIFITGDEVVQTTNYTITIGDNAQTITGNSATPITFTLPTAAAAQAAISGQPWEVRVFNNGAGTLTIDGAGAETINGQASIVISQYSGVDVWTDGTTWRAQGVSDGAVTTVKLADEAVEAAKITSDATKLEAIRDKLEVKTYLRLFEAEQFGPVSNATERGAAFEAMVAYLTTNSITGATVTAPPGTYTMTAGTSLPTGNEWLLDGVVLDYSAVADGSLVATQNVVGYLVGNGTRTAMADLASNHSIGEHTVTFASPHNLSVGDVFEIHDPTNSSFSPANVVFRNGQFCRVVGVVNSTTVRIDEPIQFAFASATVDCYRHTSWSGRIRGVTVLCNTSAAVNTVGISVDYSRDALLYKVIVSGARYTAIGIARSIDFDITECLGAENFVNDNGNDYGLGIYSSQRGIVRNSNFKAARHAVTHGTIDGSAPFRKVVFEDCVALTDPAGDGIAGFDTHGGGYDITIIRCHLEKGIVLSGRGPIVYMDCTFSSAAPYGFAVQVSQPTGGLYRFINPRFEIGGITSGSFSVFHFGDGALPTSYLTQDAVFHLENVTVRGDVASQSTFMSLWSDNTTYKVDVEINGYDDDNVTSRSRILSCTRETTTPIAANYLGVHNVKRANTGIDAILINAPYPAPTKTIEQVW